MITALQAAQKIMIDRAVDVYTEMRENLSNANEYPDHFARMGELIAQIESYTSFGNICNDIEKEEFGILGWVGDSEDMESFLENVVNLMRQRNKF